jgi:hypothetical protein
LVAVAEGMIIEDARISNWSGWREFVETMIPTAKKRIACRDLRTERPKEADMEPIKKNTCSFKGETYNHDAEVCGEEKCMICKDGKWEEFTGLFPPKASGIFSP